MTRPTRSARIPGSTTLVACLLVSLLGAQPWRSTLYPKSWQRPGEASSFDDDKLIQDFSFAGYRRGEADVPVIAGPVFDATSHGADPTGDADSTVAIQTAIDAAGAAGGGVVFLPAGEYRISPQGTHNHCLRIASPNVVLRGAGAADTFLLNTSTDMRGKRVILVQPGTTATGSPVSLTADLDGPTRRLPVASPEAFSPGDIIRLQWSFTDDWIAEHQQQTWWNAGSGRPADARYLREVTATNPAEGWIEIDVPTRYTLKTRDDARVMTVTGMLTGVGIESLAIGNLQHPGTTWGESDYADPAKPAYDTHASFLIEMRDSLDGWITDVESDQPAANSSTCHMLSNGILLNGCSRVTVADCRMSRPQYGGGGGNGYMYRLQYSNECLLRNCVADFSRHGIVISHAGTSGNVFLQCEDRETRRATGHTGSYQTGGSGSDNHMHFSHSNLWDGCHAHNSFYTASHRGTSGTVPHGLTSAHAVYWNTRGSGTRYNDIVLSTQGRYGYVIGTGGSKSGATNPTSGNTAPADHLEGIGSGDTLEPASLYLDQLARRLEPRLTLSGPTVRFPENTFTVGSAILLDGETVNPSPDLEWSVTAAPAGAAIVAGNTANGRSFTVNHPGSYTIAAAGSHEGKPVSASITLEVLPPEVPGAVIDLPPVADSHVQSGDSAAINFGTAPALLIKNDGSANFEREAFLRFDLGGIDPAEVEQASLHGYFTGSATDATGRTSVVADPDTWEETAITWSNRPTVEKIPVGEWTPVNTGWLPLDVTGVIPSGLEANQTLTFRHQIVSQSASAAYAIASREHEDPSLRPFLRFRTASPSLAEWLGDTAGLTGPDNGPADDPDEDGIANLLEAWLGTRADRPDPGAMPRGTLHDGWMEFSLQVNTRPPAGLFYFLESSDTLGNDWQPATGVVWESTGPAVNGRQPMTARVPVDAVIERRFYRFTIRTP